MVEAASRGIKMAKTSTRKKGGKVKSARCPYSRQEGGPVKKSKRVGGVTGASEERVDSPALEYYAGRTRGKVDRARAEEERQGIRGGTGETGKVIYGPHDPTAKARKKGGKVKTVKPKAKARKTMSKRTKK